MAYIIKRLLQTAPEELYWNTNDTDKEDMVAVNISLCNTGPSPADAYLFVIKKGGVIGEGAIVYGKSLVAGETIEVGQRIIPSDYAVYAYAGTVDVIALSVDILGDRGEFSVLL